MQSAVTSNGIFAAFAGALWSPEAASSHQVLLMILLGIVVIVDLLQLGRNRSLHKDR